MEHDPLCPYSKHVLAPLHEHCDSEVCEEWRCQCDLIRTLREIYSQKIDFITHLAYDAGYDEGLTVTAPFRRRLLHLFAPKRLR
jgi:hypothetical protein